ncbi:MAG: prepilin-type N-terminal cleavage/methylation domain-containing protein [Candidatus Omnitrophica bacterium]|nr:prepilin-type N-terminal cleavage/methylation domain-containing protein [Candidatus Omnitrophota bacterium]
MRKGFTLLELLIVIIIIGILAIFALPQFFNTADVAKNTKAKQVLGEIRSAEVICNGILGSWQTWVQLAAGCKVPDSNQNAVAMADPTAGDPYWTYTITTTGSGTATATKKTACGGGCNNTHAIDLTSGAITSTAP